MLSVKNLKKTYANGVTALKNVSLKVPRGLFGLLGPNGAGKSTLLRTIATLQSPDSGVIEFEGVDIQSNVPAFRSRMGYLPQEFGVYPGVTAFELLQHLAKLKGLRRHGVRDERVESLLRLTHLWEFKDRHVCTYSGGMRRRFGLAQALLTGPQLLIVDEPTAGLDPDERNSLLDLLASVGETASVLISTHFVQDVADLCPNVAILNNGRILLKASPAEAVRNMHGQVWQKTVTPTEAIVLRSRLTVLSAPLVGGNRRMRVYSEDIPAQGFQVCEAILEDAYFLRLRQDAGLTNGQLTYVA